MIAYKRALSKFKSLPVNNSASNSAAMDDSKSSNEPAIFSTCFIFIPNTLTCAAAAPNSLLLPPKDNLIASDVLATSLIISFSFKRTLLFNPTALADCTKLT